MNEYYCAFFDIWFKGFDMLPCDLRLSLEFLQHFAFPMFEL